MLIQNTLKGKLLGNLVRSNNLMLAFLLLVGAFWLSNNTLYADIDQEYKKQLEAEGASRERRVEGYFDMQYNTVSNIQFTVHNDGRTFYDSKLGRLTGMWPRGSVNGYVYGGGIWVGTRKRLFKKRWDEELQDSVLVVLRDTTLYFNRWDWDNPVINGNDTVIVQKLDSIYTAEYEIDTNRTGKLVDVTYNSRDGLSYMVPGRIEDGDAAISTNTTSYRVYFSMDYNSGSGAPLLEESGPAWPIWDDLSDENKVLKYDRYFGHYIKNELDRSTATYPKGPAFISGEDIFSTYKDTDMAKMNPLGSVGWLNDQGYPLRVQYEQMIYSWGFGDYRDFIFIKYDQINRNTDTLWDMWLAPIFDIDIGLITDGGNGAYNDKTCFYGMEPNRQYPDEPDPARAGHNMAYQYSESNRGEGGKGFGYVGFVFLESPAVIGETVDFNRYAKDEAPAFRLVTDSIGFVRKEGTWLRTDPATGMLDTCRQLHDGSWVCGDIDGDWYIESNPNNMTNVPWYPVEEQLGLRTFRNWPNGEDPRTPEAMYNWISRNGAGGWDGPQKSGDMRYMMATGPFHLRPGDTSRTVVGLVLAATGKGGDATGDTVDLAELVRKVEFMQTVYDENFRAPQPPDPAVITSTTPLNNGMVIHWDSTSELSTDFYERGMAFMGYRVYRARRDNLDTFNLNDIAGNSLYPAGQGPFGWKEIKNYSMPLPYRKSTKYPTHTEGSGPLAQTFFGVDSLVVLGPYYIKNLETGQMEIDPKSILSVKVPMGVELYKTSILDIAIKREKETPGENRFPILEASGWYADSVYGQRLNAVVSYIDSSYSPWGRFFYNHNDFDLNRSALFGKADSIVFSRPDAPKSFIWDSIMLCRLELNPALAKINPLFYKQVRVRVSPETVDSFTVKYDSVGYIDNINGSVLKSVEHWKVRDSLDADGNQVYDLIGNLRVPIRTPVIIDTLYDVSSIQYTQLPGEGDNAGESFWTINCMILRDSATRIWLDTAHNNSITEQNIYSHIAQGKDWLRDMTHFNFVRDSLYQYISQGWVKNIHTPDFGGGGIYTIPFQSSDIAKNEVIIPYMREITNNRTFVDIGDDPVMAGARADAYINEVDDPTRTERLLNNVPYYYKVVSFDEGDFLQPTPTKSNVGVRGLPNFVETYPASDAPANPLRFDIISTEGALGGVFNPRLFALDEERASQLFAGDTIEVEFIPESYGTELYVTHQFSGGMKDSAVSGVPAGVYRTGIKITNITKDLLLYNYGSNMEVTPCYPSSATTWTDNAMLRTNADTVTNEGGAFAYSDMSLPNSRQAYDAMNVHFTTGEFREPEFCYSLAEENIMWGNLGFSFDIGLKQHGGVYRADSVDLSGLSHEVSTIVYPLSATGDSWADQTWYLDSTYKAYGNAPAINNRRVLFGGFYGSRSAVDVGFKEQMPADYQPWLEAQIPPLRLSIPETWMSSGTTVEEYNTRFDNGPGIYEVTFKQGGVDTLDILVGPNAVEPVRFIVDYLEVDINDTYSFNRHAPDLQGVDSVAVSYPSEIPPMELPLQMSLSYYADIPWICKTPHPKNLGYTGGNPNDFYRKYNLYATGYVDSRSNNNSSQFTERVALDADLVNTLSNGGQYPQYVGKQNRYYLTGYSADGRVLDFVHNLNIAGAQWAVAYNMGGYRPNGNADDASLYGIFDNYTDAYKEDFKAGDKIKLLSWGGVSGFPARGAKVRFAVSNPYIDYTDDMMDEIKIVPNPYIITHQAQSSPYGAEIYFTKLPAVCEIEIFTAAGDLVTSVSHNESIEGTRKGIAIYDLLTKNGQRVQSQTLVALIKEPNGAMTTKHFSVIVGGFRVVE